jgi:hypothetical protein
LASAFNSHLGYAPDDQIEINPYKAMLYGLFRHMPEYEVVGATGIENESYLFDNSANFIGVPDWLPPLLPPKVGP